MAEKQKKRRMMVNWWIPVAVNTIASLLAFSLSLLVNEHSRTEAKKVTASNIAQVTLSNIDEVANNLEIVTTYYDEFIDLHNTIRSYKNYKHVPDSICKEIVDYVEGWDIFAIHKAPELTFSTTFELWDYLENIPLIRRIGNCYAYENAFLELYNREQATIVRLTSEAGLEKIIDKRQKMATLVNNAAFVNYMSRADAMSAAYHSLLERIRRANNLNKEDMGVSDEDLRNLVAPKHMAEDAHEDYLFVVGPDM
jgi:hypothetical protein